MDFAKQKYLIFRARINNPSVSKFMTRIVTILLTHQSRRQVDAMLSYWRSFDENQEFIIAYGGNQAESFAGMANFVNVLDARLRTRDHPRERQSYQGVMKAVRPLLVQLSATHIHMAEYDEIPVVDDLNARLISLMSEEDCDVLGHRLLRVDNTSHPHYLDHAKQQEFMDFWGSISCRKDPEIVLSMLGCGSFWKWKAFDAVANLDDEVGVYLELFMPTAAHHLGFRVRPLSDQDQFMATEVLKNVSDLVEFKKRGAWRVHPVKEMWVG